MANIWGRKEKVVCVASCNSETERGGARKGPAGVGYSLQCIAAEIYEYRSGEMWGNFTAGIVCHSPRLSMWSLPPRRLFHLQLSHTHSFSHTHTHTHSSQCYQRRPGAVVCPCQKVTGVPIGKPKIKGPWFLLYVVIPCLCLGLYKLLTSGFDWEYITYTRQSLKRKISHDVKFQICHKSKCDLFFACITY